MGVVKTEEDVLDNDKTTSWTSCIIGFFLEIRNQFLIFLRKENFFLRNMTPEYSILIISHGHHQAQILCRCGIERGGFFCNLAPIIWYGSSVDFVFSSSHVESDSKHLLSTSLFISSKLHEQQPIDNNKWLLMIS